MRKIRLLLSGAVIVFSLAFFSFVRVHSEEKSEEINLDFSSSCDTSYVSDLEAYRFETNEKYAEALYTIELPKNAKAFSLSLKIGNSYLTRKPGKQDYAVIAVGYNRGAESFEIARSAHIQNEQKFLILSLGDERSPLELWEEADRIYVTIEAHNAAEDEMDVFFGEPRVAFYEDLASDGSLSVYGYDGFYRFEKTATDQNVFYANTMLLPTILFFVLAVGILIFRFWRHGR